jgi:hypothetical protein
LGIKVSKYYLVTERDPLTSFLGNYRFELLLLCFGSGRRFSLFGLYLLGVHLVVYLKGRGGKNLKEGFSVVSDVDDVGGARRDGVFFVIDLKIEVLVGVSNLGGEYDLLVRNVLPFS